MIKKSKYDQARFSSTALPWAGRANDETGNAGKLHGTPAEGAGPHPEPSGRGAVAGGAGGRGALLALPFPPHLSRYGRRVGAGARPASPTGAGCAAAEERE